MTFITALSHPGSRRIFIKEGIKIVSRSQSLGDFLEAILAVISNGAISSIRLDRSSNLGIEPGNFSRAHNHFTPVSQRQVYLCAIGSNYAFAFTDYISCLETPHIACSVADKGFTGERRNFGNDLGLGHGNTPDTVFDAPSVGIRTMQNN